MLKLIWLSILCSDEKSYKRYFQAIEKHQHEQQIKLSRK